MRFTKYHENLNKHINIELDLYATNIISSKQTLTHPVKVQCVRPHHPEPGYYL